MVNSCCLHDSQFCQSKSVSDLSSVVIRMCGGRKQIVVGDMMDRVVFHTTYFLHCAPHDVANLSIWPTVNKRVQRGVQED